MLRKTIYGRNTCLCTIVYINEYNNWDSSLTTFVSLSNLFLNLLAVQDSFLTLWHRWCDRNHQAGNNIGGCGRSHRNLWCLGLSSSISPWFRGLQRTNRSKKERESQFNIFTVNLSASPSCLAVVLGCDSWAREEKVIWGKELWALSICCTTEDSTQSWHHLGLTCMWRKRRDWKLWLQMMAEPFGRAAGTGFLWEEWLERWMKDWIRGWMEGWTGHQVKVRKEHLQLMLGDGNAVSTYSYSLLFWS